jgi:integrase
MHPGPWHGCASGAAGLVVRLEKMMKRMAMELESPTRKGSPVAQDKATADGKSGWKASLRAILNKHAGTRDNGNVAACRTREQAGVMIFGSFRTLREVLGFRIDNPRNLDERHITTLVEHWYRNGRATTTMKQNLSLLRKFARWIGKPGMVKALPAYLPHVDPAELRTSSVLKHSKSWSENGINLDAKIAEADECNEKFGLMLRIAIAFGLRAKELVMLKPWKADTGDALIVLANAGPKNGRSRVYKITTSHQRETLDYVKERTLKTQHLGCYYTRRGKRATLKYNLKDYQRRLQEIGITKKHAGVTGHGFRAENAENMKLDEDVLPATLGEDCACDCEVPRRW